MRSLVARALQGGYGLTSLMAKLRCASFAERMHVPAFIYFFQMLYPFSWVAKSKAATAAAAGGCMLVRADALEKAGGIEAIRHALIDDCALAAKLKAVGPIWLGLTNRAVSLRRYDDFAEVKHMITRSAYAQLRYSPLLLIGTLAAMALVFVVPPLFAIFAHGLARWLGLAAWVLMALSFLAHLAVLPRVAALGHRIAGHRVVIYLLHARLRLPARAPARRPVEGPRPGQHGEPAMTEPIVTTSAEFRSGKGSHDENFPVASVLVRKRHRPAVLAFYEFVRVADDIADHASMSAQDKLARLDNLEGTLLGRNDDEPQGVALRTVLRDRGL